MKIKETIERECCQEQDLMPYGGKPLPSTKYMDGMDGIVVMVDHPKTFRFCKHCGQIWCHKLGDDPPGRRVIVTTFTEEQRKYA